MWTRHGLAWVDQLLEGFMRDWRRRVTDFRRSGNDAGDAELLTRRMSALNIDSDTFARLEPALFGNLQTLCRECERPGQCRHDVCHDPAGPAWEDYCSNAVVLIAVKELRWFRTAARH
jgi:hypothetical protein